MSGSDQIRNILQTHQERTIIKQAPDVIVYIDGLPYMINKWTELGPAVVNFNDFVISASGSADVNTPIPTASVSLSIPNHRKSLFMAPGGNVPLTTMSEIKVFTKGYYLTDDGQTVYHRIFWGLIDNISQAESNTSLEITLSCKGILHLLDIMQYNVSPAVMTATQSGSRVTPMKDIQAALTPIAAIRQMFLATLGNEFGNIDTVDPGTILPVVTAGVGGDAQNAKDIMSSVYSSSVSKWFQHLQHLSQGTRLFGLTKDLADCPIQMRPADANSTVGMTTRGDGEKNLVSEAVGAQDYNLKLVQQYLPFFNIGEINLTQSNIVSRLQRVQEMVDLMGWEVYQDVDGSIIIKPPLYNVNPLNTSVSMERNPFVINLDERIGSDSLVEDESQIRLTRVAVQGTLNEGNQMHIDVGGVNFLPVGIYADPMLIKQFGLRHEGVKQINYIGRHANTLYAYAVAELTKTIKKWKSYTVTIPMRPELRLGLPIHIPWRDIMAYLENVSWTYTRGNSATMTLSCSMVRTREIFGVTTGGVTNYAPVCNAILRWTASAGVPQPGSIVNTSVTIPTPEAIRQTPLQRQFLQATALSADVTGNPQDLPGCAWRVQNDLGVGSAPGPAPEPSYFKKAGITPDKFNARFASSFFTQAQDVDNYYFLAIQTYAMPYTDDQGYVLARPFPWGRFTTLEEALDTFTRSRKHRSGGVLPFESNASVSTATAAGLSATDPAVAFLKNRTDAFILTGLGTPSLTQDATGTTGTAVIKKLTDLMSFMSDDTTFFVVTYPDSTDPSGSGISPNPYEATAQAAREGTSVRPGVQEAGMDAAKADSYATGMTSPTDLHATPSSTWQVVQ